MHFILANFIFFGYLPSQKVDLGTSVSSNIPCELAILPVLNRGNKIEGFFSRTAFNQHGEINIKGLGAFGKVMELFAKQFLGTGVKRVS